MGCVSFQMRKGKTYEWPIVEHVVRAVDEACVGLVAEGTFGRGHGFCFSTFVKRDGL